MSENKLNISDLLETHRRDRERLYWEGSFRDYFELVMQNPSVSKLSPSASICPCESINPGIIVPPRASI